MSVQIYVEGGGDQDRTLTKCRKAFHDLLDPHCSRKPKIVASGSRHEAFKDFSKSVATEAACSNPDIEKIPKQDVLSGLYKASRKSKKGSYHKTKHGFEILSGLDFLRVCEASARAKAFLIFIAGKLEE